MKTRLFKTIQSLAWGLLCLVSVTASSCHSLKEKEKPHPLSALPSLNQTLVEVLVKDRFAPPVASRIHAYANLAYYEALSSAGGKSFSGLLPGYERWQGEVSARQAPALAELTFTHLARTLTYSPQAWQDWADRVQQRYNLGQEDWKELGRKSERLSKHLLDWAGQDGFKERLALGRYTTQNNPAQYQLTPPAYHPPIEPHWGTLRPFLCSDISAFYCTYDYRFSQAEGSAFHHKNKDLQGICAAATEDQLASALFWDCNPVQMERFGHAMRFSFRMTPSSHWICILNSIMEKEQMRESKRALIYATLSLAMADAFIACWRDKYHYNTVRPITYIRANISENWMPALETPSFPEYPSGHSSVSAAAATILEHFLGYDYAFRDDSQSAYDAAPRSYNSFRAAAEEAGASRVFGGIHYPEAISDGFNQGQKIGNHIWEITHALR